MSRLRIGIAICVAALLLLIGAASASAAIVYEKGGKIYAASNSGKGSRLLTAGHDPSLMPSGLTVIYTDAAKAAYAVPLAGGTPVKLAATDCADCLASPAPDSSSIASVDGKGNLDIVPIDGSPSTRLATGIGTFASFSPDSKQVVYDQDATHSLFTVSASGGAPTQLPLQIGTTPVWTKAGIVALSAAPIGGKVQFRLVLLDAAGGAKRILQRKTFTSEQEIDSGKGLQVPFQAAGSNVVTLELGARSRYTLRLVSTSSGKVAATRVFKNLDDVQSISASGKTLLVLKKGKPKVVNFKSGKSKSLGLKGVKAADMN